MHNVPDTKHTINIMNIKGDSDKQEFNVNVNIDDLLTLIRFAAEKAQENYDEGKATSPGGFPTAIFTALLPAKARKSVGWDIVTEGWNPEKAEKAFLDRLERKPGGGGGGGKTHAQVKKEANIVAAKALLATGSFTWAMIAPAYPDLVEDDVK